MGMVLLLPTQTDKNHDNTKYCVDIEESGPRNNRISESILPRSSVSRALSKYSKGRSLDSRRDQAQFMH